MNFPSSSKPQACGLALTLTVLTAGCVGDGPNTQRGAVGGAALGALAGAIIGNNSGGGGHALGGAAIGAVAGGLAGGTLGNAEDNRRGTLYHSEAEATTNVVVENAPPPPPPQTEYITVQPSQAAVWVPGYWAYASDRRYVWVAGHWEIPPPQYRHYYPAHWQHTRRGYVYVRGYWN